MANLNVFGQKIIINPARIARIAEIVKDIETIVFLGLGRFN
jgi:hypothetical protein